MVGIRPHFQLNLDISNTYIRIPLGLKNAPATFQRMMNHILQPFINQICVVYLDVILIFSTSLQQHVESINKIFKRLNQFNFKKLTN